MTAPPYRRRRVARLLLAGSTAIGVLVGSVALAAPASADQGSIDHVQQGRGTVHVLYSLPAGVSGRPDLTSVAVTFDGKPVKAQASLASADDQIRRTTVLAIDVSNSMGRRGKFAQAKRAAQVFLRSVPDNVHVGIVTFAGRVTVAQHPTLDRAASRAVVRRLRLSLGTHLYDGVDRAVRELGAAGQRGLLVLSDGRDTSTTPLSSVTRRLRSSKVRVDVVALAQSPHDRALMASLARAGRGRVIDAARPAQLSNVFSSEAAALSHQLLVSFSPPTSRTAREGTLAVAVAAGGTTYSDAAFVTMPRTSAAPQKKPATGAVRFSAVTTSWLYSTNIMLGGLAAIALGCLVLVLAIFGGLGKQEVSLDKRIAAYTGKGGGTRLSAPPPQGAKAQAVGMAQRALEGNRGVEAKLHARLEAAGVAFRPAEWLLLHAAIALGTGMLLLVLTAGSVLLTAVAFLAGVVLPWMYLGHRRSKRLKAFNAQLPATLQLMAGSLQAGLSLAQGMDTIVREGADPVAGEFRRALVETRLGVQVEDALDSIAERMDSDDFRWTVMAVRIQREVGGNLALLLGNVSVTMREREYLRRQVKSLSAEGRFSAYILLAMPPGVIMFEAVTRGAYLHPLISTPIGWVMLAAMVMLMGIGAFMMSRMIKLEV
jgi:tight adherence protein B